MTTFFEKLKKGMNVKDLSPPEEETLPEENSREEQSPPKEIEQQVEEPDKPGTISKGKVVPGKKPSIVLTTTEIKPDEKITPAKKRKKTEKKTKKIKTTKKKKIEVHPVKSAEDGAAKPQFNGVKEEPALDVTIEGKKESRWFEPEGELTVDVYQTDEEIVIQSAIAGVEPGDLDITIENDLVTISGIREKPPEKEKRNYFHQECYWGRFSREIILPVEVDNSRVQATIKNGILTIGIPKIERERKRKIIIKE